MGVEELRVTFGKGENYRVIPIHFLFAKLGQQMCEILLMVHKLIGCDVTSRIGTKQAAASAILVNWWNLDQPTCQTLQLLGWQKAIYAQCFVQRIIVRPVMICGISCIQKRKHQFNLCCLPHGCYMDISYVPLHCSYMSKSVVRFSH